MGIGANTLRIATGATVLSGLLGGFHGRVTWAQATAVVDTTPPGMVAFFPLTACPAGWDELDEARGRFLMATSDPDGVGNTVGTPLEAGTEPPSHTHTYQTSVQLNTQGCDCSEGGAGFTGASDGNKDVPHSPPGTTGASEAYSYTQLLVCQKQPPSSGEEDTYAQNMVAFFNAPSCPMNWEMMSSAGSKVNGVFAIPFYDPETAIGTVSGTPITPGQPWTHTHSFKTSVTLAGSSVQAKSGTKGGQAKSGTYAFNGTASPVTINFPYLQLLLCKKAAYTSNTLPDGLPHKILMFYAESDCPTNWVIAPSGFNRPLLGLPSGVEPNQTYGTKVVPSPGHDYWHAHSFSGNVDVGSQRIYEAKGCSEILCNKGHADTGNPSFSGTTYYDGALPYITLSLCQPDT